MAGELQPVVMFPRYSTLAGASEFTTIAMDVTEFQAAILNVWRGKIVGTIAFTCQESTDQVSWTTCAGTNCSAYDPGQETEGPVSATLTKRWFRIKAVLAGAGVDPQATFWSVGFLEQRQQ